MCRVGAGRGEALAFWLGDFHLLLPLGWRKMDCPILRDLKYNAAALASWGAPTHPHPITRGAVLPPGSAAAAPRGHW